MKASDFDKKFENGENLINDLELKKGKRVLHEQRRVNVDIPEWMIKSLDKEAGRLGVTRQSIIKVWLAERLEDKHHQKTG